MNKAEQDREITKTLTDILMFVGADTKYAEYAQLHSYLHWLITKAKEKQ